MNTPTVTPHYDPKQAARDIDAALRWIEYREGKHADAAYTLQILGALLEEAQAALREEEAGG